MPSERDGLLLRAATAGPGAALKAWSEWARGRDLNAAALRARRLFGAVHANLSANRASHPTMPQLEAFHRHTWRRNLRLVGRWRPVLDGLEAAGLSDFLVLKGAALATLYYPDWGCRPMLDLDLFVHPGEVDRALSLLDGLGFTSVYGPRFRLASLRRLVHSVGFADAEGTEVDVHWHLLMQCQGPGLTPELFAHAQRMALADRPVRTLDATDHLFHSLLHGYLSNLYKGEEGLYWVLDAMAILSRDPAAIDWERMTQRAQARRLTRSLHATLEYLRTAVGAPIPAQVLRRLEATPPSLVERLEQALGGMAESRERLLAVLLARYLRLRDKAEFRRGPLGIRALLRAHWNLDEHEALTGLLLRKSATEVADLLTRAWSSATSAALPRP